MFQVCYVTSEFSIIFVELVQYCNKNFETSFFDLGNGLDRLVGRVLQLRDEKSESI